MKALLDSKQMKDVDSRTIKERHVPGLLLMERAALFACNIITEMIDPGESVLVLAGAGNNGGDGIAIARILHAEGIPVAVILAGNRDKASKDNKAQLEMAESYGVPFLEDAESMSSFGLIVDALVGVGGSGSLRDDAAALVSAADLLPVKRVAIDMPSGVSCDDGSVSGPAFMADVTITFGYEKVGMHLYPGRSYCGRILRDRLGMPENFLPDPDSVLWALEKSDIRRLAPARMDDCHKGDMGKVLVIAGSSGMAGAAYLAAAGAFSAGCGMVRIASCEDNRQILQSLIPEAMFTSLDIETYEDKLDECFEWADAVVIGPGLGDSLFSLNVLGFVLSTTTLPVTVDADGLNLYSRIKCNIASRDVVFTPHMGEFARLTGISPGEIAAERIALVRDQATSYHVHMVLKDASTLVFTAGGRGYISTSGNSGMAVAGSGDVLSGVITALMARGINSSVAAPLGVYLHGLAGDAVRSERSAESMRAIDIVNGLDRIWQEV